MKNINILIRNRLENVKESNKKTKYRIINKEGKIYSQFLGFVELNKNVYGHLFDYNQVRIVEEVLTSNGFNDIIIKKDNVGSLFNIAVDSPFDNPIKFFKLTLFTVFFIPLFLFLIQFAFSTVQSEQNNEDIDIDKNAISNIGTSLLNHIIEGDEKE